MLKDGIFGVTRFVSRHLWCKIHLYLQNKKVYMIKVITHNQTSVVLKNHSGRKKKNKIKSITRKIIRKGKKIFSLANHDKDWQFEYMPFDTFCVLLKNCFLREDRSGLLCSPWFLFTFPLPARLECRQRALGARVFKAFEGID